MSNENIIIREEIQRLHRRGLSSKEIAREAGARDPIGAALALMEMEGEESEDYRMPEGLCLSGRIAYHLIVGLAKAGRGGLLPFTGGGKIFYSPMEWAQRGERYGRNSKLIVTYDGAPDIRDVVVRFSDGLGLDRFGLFIEHISGWCSGVYRI
jgi:hypothetical protein